MLLHWNVTLDTSFSESVCLSSLRAIIAPRQGSKTGRRDTLIRQLTLQSKPRLPPPSKELPWDERKLMKTTLNALSNLNPHPILYHWVFPNMEIFFPLTILFLLIVLNTEMPV